ncbi:uncharacterized protein I206_105270 [Kwoniella pini CBS 10737]|uniref:Uncharacterized protein n=1 Tax=Kwoniella pini CBS 10737 TaxID=1296096 RepID=A0A1B9I4N6_9TREE|nr:uncharacterized protein I206_03821 [Kwoniella pini CBS 10737]OCF50497.1 hypothetical protein I206_03821 [Kwoniella pini CBS 10737]
MSPQSDLANGTCRSKVTSPSDLMVLKMGKTKPYEILLGPCDTFHSIDNKYYHRIGTSNSYTVSDPRHWKSTGDKLPIGKEHIGSCSFIETKDPETLPNLSEYSPSSTEDADVSKSSKMIARIAGRDKHSVGEGITQCQVHDSGRFRQDIEFFRTSSMPGYSHVTHTHSHALNNPHSHVTHTHSHLTHTHSKPSESRFEEFTAIVNSFWVKADGKETVLNALANNEDCLSLELFMGQNDGDELLPKGHLAGSDHDT